MSNTQEMPVVPAAVAAPAENVVIPSVPSVKNRMRIFLDGEKDQIHARAMEDIDKVKADAAARIEAIRAQEAEDIAICERFAALVEREVPEPVLRVGHPPYVDGPLSEAQEKALAGYVGRPLRSDDSEGRS